MSLALPVVPLPVPRVVVDGLRSLARGRPRCRIVLAPDTDLLVSLAAAGHLDAFELLAILDRDPSKHGLGVLGAPVVAYERLAEFDADVVAVASLRHHEAVVSAVREAGCGVPIVDLCANLALGPYRAEIAARLFALAETNARLDRLGTPPDGGSSFTSVELRIPRAWGLGDKLCALSSARAFARIHPELRVTYNELPEVVRAYGDDLVRSGRAERVLPVLPEGIIRQKGWSVAANYAGCYHLAMGVPFEDAPRLELPRLAPFPTLDGVRYAVLQPTANYAKPNLDGATLESIVCGIDLPVYLAGRRGGANAVANVSDAYQGDELAMLRLIQHAAIVLTPRSASAHIAAAYGVPAVVWTPEDGENWHLDYDDWSCALVSTMTEDIGTRIASSAARLLRHVPPPMR